MPHKEARKKLKEIEKELSNLEKERRKTEFLPCRGDADLKLKEMDLQTIRHKMLEVEKKRDRFILNSGSVKHFQWEDSTPKE